MISWLLETIWQYAWSPSLFSVSEVKLHFEYNSNKELYTLGNFMEIFPYYGKYVPNLKSK